MDIENQCQVTDDCLRQSCLEAPMANSTFISDIGNESSQYSRHNSANKSSRFPMNVNVSNVSVASNRDPEDSVGHISHIPRKPPTPATYTIPSINKSVDPEQETGDDLFGMIKLKDNDVCYTSGSIEWVGRKRCYPINSGFKVINESSRQGNEPLQKRVRRLDKTFSLGPDNKIKECDCADVLPTVNAIVDHLNALHEAVDLVDLRLNNLEDIVGKK